MSPKKEKHGQGGKGVNMHGSECFYFFKNTDTKMRKIGPYPQGVPREERGKHRSTAAER